MSGDLKPVPIEQQAMLVKQWCVFLCAAIAISAVLGCAVGSNTEKSHAYAVYEMRKDSIAPAFSLTNSDNFLAWLDESRVLFEAYEMSGSDRAVKKPAGEKAVRVRKLFVWDIHTGEVSPHTSEPLQSSMCFADGLISYLVHRGGSTVRMTGPFGRETETSRPDSAQKMEFNPFTCTYYRRVDLPPPKFGGFMYPLRLEDGWIERGPGGAWLHTKNGSPRKLVVSTDSLGSVYPHKHSMYAGKYLYYHSNRSGSETWAFSGSSDMELLRFPEGPWETGAIEPVRVGLLLRSKHVGKKSFWDPGHSGLYLRSGAGDVEKLTSGNVYALRVSNNGCLIAAFIDPWNSDHRKHRLVVFDICKRDAKYVG